MTHKEFFPYSSSPLQSTMLSNPPTHSQTRCYFCRAVGRQRWPPRARARATTKASLQWLRRARLVTPRRGPQRCFPGTFCPGPYDCHFRKLCSAKLLQSLNESDFIQEGRRHEEHVRNFNASLVCHCARRRADLVAAAIGAAAQAIDERCYPLFKLRAFTIQAWVT